MNHKMQLHMLPLSIKKFLMVVLDAVLIPLSLWLALSLRYGYFYSEFNRSFLDFVVLVVFSILVFTKLGLYRAVLRYLNWQALEVILRGVLASTAILLAIMLLHPEAHLPNSTFIIYALISFVFVAGSRFIARWVLGVSNHSNKMDVAIYGAGVSGQQLYSLLRQGGIYNPRVFLDDKPSLHGRVINGLSVLDPKSEFLEEDLIKLGVKSILLSMPSMSVSARRVLMARLDTLPFKVRTVPGMDDILSGKVSLDQVRDVCIEDLLGRDPVQPRIDLIEKCIRDKNVLVTGAGGSIGSELCRQAVALGARRVVLLDISEFALYQIESELHAMERTVSGDVELLPLLGSVLDMQRMMDIFDTLNIDTVYHAAAYKHVPLVEHNPTEGLRNNSLGTLYLAHLAGRYAVGNFVLISTDKAVRPTNVMGASKRLAELALQALQPEYPATVFCMVRFGNVLGSSGSVIPLFRKQIASGEGKITVTHPDITRFFMTIPEAVELVIQAASMAQGGDVFVLDMGQPIRIVDLARTMIRLSGLDERNEQNPDGDIEIVFTGLRPGEKLYEELLIGDAVLGTEHPKIMRAEEDFLSWDIFNIEMNVLQNEIIARDLPAIRVHLGQLVKGYKAHDRIEDFIWCVRHVNPRKHSCSLV